MALSSRPFYAERPSRRVARRKRIFEVAVDLALGFLLPRFAPRFILIGHHLVFRSWLPTGHSQPAILSKALPYRNRSAAPSNAARFCERGPNLVDCARAKSLRRTAERTIIISYAFDRITVLFERTIVSIVTLARRSTLSSKNNMQTATLKHSDVAPNPQVLRIWRPSTGRRRHRRTVVPSAAVYKPSSKWTVVAAFILAVVLHAGPVVWVDMQQERPPVVAAVPAVIHPMEKAILEKGAETGAASDVAGRAAAD